MPVIVKSNRLPAFADRLQRKLNEAVGELAKDIADSARQRAPVDTGALRDSIYVDEVSQGEYEVGASVEYATFVEYGTVHTPAQPFLRPAYEEHKDQITKLMHKAVRGALGD